MNQYPQQRLDLRREWKLTTWLWLKMVSVDGLRGGKIFVWTNKWAVEQSIYAAQKENGEKRKARIEQVKTITDRPIRLKANKIKTYIEYSKITVHYFQYNAI